MVLFSSRLLPFTLISCASSAALETFIVQRADFDDIMASQPDGVPATTPAPHINASVGGFKVKDKADDFLNESCIDRGANDTGFDVWTREGKLGPASCTDLKGKCRNWINSSNVLFACPVSCYICDPHPNKAKWGPPCYDAVVTGVRFKNGPTATCKDLANYCNHKTLYYHVQAACRQTCGLCEPHEGHVKGTCVDLEPHDQPEFNVAGNLATCPDLIDFCSGHSDAYLIRHKCPKTCGTCPHESSTTHSSYTTSDEMSFNSGESEQSDCQRRRRWGFCSTRRRRNF